MNPNIAILFIFVVTTFSVLYIYSIDYVYGNLKFGKVQKLITTNEINAVLETIRGKLDSIQIELSVREDELNRAADANLDVSNPLASNSSSLRESLRVFCPKLVRVGTADDGGKWVCNPWAVPHKCVIFSLGLQNHITFDQQIQQLTNSRCRIYGFDKDDQSTGTKEAYKSINGETTAVRIAGVNNDKLQSSTIQNLMLKKNVTTVEILKIDIEGAEEFALPSFLNATRVCQILIELHGPATQMLSMLRTMAKRQYRIYTYENNGLTLDACEFSLVHDTCIERYGLVPLANYIPID